MLTVERAKRRVESITVVADFSDRMDTGDSVFDATITLEVFSGEDSTPDEMLYLPAIIDTQAVSQRIKLGIVGVVYNIQFSVLTVAGLILEQTTRLAVLPDAPGAIPQFIPFYFTSWPYPLDVLDGAAFDMAILPSRLRPQIFFIPEGLRINLSGFSGTLIGALKSYVIPPEGYAVTLGEISGTLINQLQTYTVPPEWLAFSLGTFNGTLISSLVEYSMQPDWISFDLSSISGTLA
jgi:hypothetical protein